MEEAVVIEPTEFSTIKQNCVKDQLIAVVSSRKYRRLAIVRSAKRQKLGKIQNGISMRRRLDVGKCAQRQKRGKIQIGIS